jgi:hypothetical protein
MKTIECGVKGAFMPAMTVRQAGLTEPDLWVRGLTLLWQIFRVHGIPESLFL